MFVLIINNQLIHLGLQWVERLLNKREDWVPTPAADGSSFLI